VQEHRAALRSPEPFAKPVKPTLSSIIFSADHT
jgi:hypothetical protein